MKKNFFIFLFLFITCFGFGQDVNKIVIKMAKKEVRSYRDFALSIQLSRDDNKLFRLPKKLAVGNLLSIYPDLVVEIEKKNDEGVYQQYYCHEASAPLPSVYTEKTKYEKVLKKTLVDSLVFVKCLDSGIYRLRIGYNQKPNDGFIHEVQVSRFSEWDEFIVVVKEIILSR